MSRGIIFSLQRKNSPPRFRATCAVSTSSRSTASSRRFRKKARSGHRIWHPPLHIRNKSTQHTLFLLAFDSYSFFISSIERPVARAIIDASTPIDLKALAFSRFFCAAPCEIPCEIPRVIPRFSPISIPAVRP